MVHQSRLFEPAACERVGENGVASRLCALLYCMTKTSLKAHCASLCNVYQDSLLFEVNNSVEVADTYPSATPTDAVEQGRWPNKFRFYLVLV